MHRRDRGGARILPQPQERFQIVWVMARGAGGISRNFQLITYNPSTRADNSRGYRGEYNDGTGQWENLAPSPLALEYALIIPQWVADESESIYIRGDIRADARRTGASNDRRLAVSYEERQSLAGGRTEGAGQRKGESGRGLGGVEDAMDVGFQEAQEMHVTSEEEEAVRASEHEERERLARTELIYDRLDRRLAHQNLPTPADGSCFYHVVAISLARTGHYYGVRQNTGTSVPPLPENQKEVRNLVASFLRENVGAWQGQKRGSRHILPFTLMA